MKNRTLKEKEEKHSKEDEKEGAKWVGERNERKGEKQQEGNGIGESKEEEAGSKRRRKKLIKLE